jgi:hypothetical protein
MMVGPAQLLLYLAWAAGAVSLVAQVSTAVAVGGLSLLGCATLRLARPNDSLAVRLDQLQPGFTSRRKLMATLIALIGCAWVAFAVL